MKLGTKIIGIFLGAALAAGVSTAAVLQINKRNVEPAKAETGTLDFSTGLYSSYGNANYWRNEHLQIVQRKDKSSTSLPSYSASTTRWSTGHTIHFYVASGYKISSLTFSIDLSIPSSTSTTYVNGATSSTWHFCTITTKNATSERYVKITPDTDVDYFWVRYNGQSQFVSCSYEYSVDTNPETNQYELVSDPARFIPGRKVIIATKKTYQSVDYTKVFCIGSNLPTFDAGNYLGANPDIELTDGFNIGSIATLKYGTAFTLGGGPGAWTLNAYGYKLIFNTSTKIEFHDSPAEGDCFEFDFSKPISFPNAISIHGAGESFSSMYLYPTAQLNDICYKIMTTSTNVETYIFQQIVEPSTQALAYAGNFLGGLSTGADPVCSADGNTDLEQLQFAWAVLASGFGNLDAFDQYHFTFGEADENGSDIQKTLALYDFIVQKYGTQLESQNCDNYNFMGRSYASSSSNRLSPIASPTNIGLIVMISAFVGASAVGVYFLIRKKKEQ